MLTFHHAPWSRSSSILWLLEELGVDYEIAEVDIRGKGGAPESYRDIQPNKKVPAIVHDGNAVSERAAICLYLTETFPEAGLAPKIGDRERAPFLTWLVYCDSVFDPAVAARAHGLEYSSNDYSFGLFDDLVGNLERTLANRPYVAGEFFTAADTQLGSGIHYTTHVLKVLPERPVFQAYLERVQARPAYKTSAAKDFEMAKAAGMVGG